MNKLPLEKEVEAAFFDYLQQTPIWEFMYRQVVLPLGIADIVGLCTSGDVYVVEVKRGTIDRKTIGQLIGYIGQVDNAIEMVADSDYVRERFRIEHTVVGHLVGKSIDNDALKACKALGYTVYLYDIEDGKITFNEYVIGNDYLCCSLSENDCSSQLLEISNGVVNWIRKYAKYEFGQARYMFEKDSHEVKESAPSTELLNSRNTVTLYQSKEKTT